MYLSVRHYTEGRYSLSSKSDIHEYTEPITKKWLHGDIIDPTTQETSKREAKAHKSIVGIIDFLNRVRVGMTPRGVSLYNFHPYDPAYPTMVVASKLKTTQNMVAIASLEHWNDKHPRAGIQHIFGPVGDQTAETAALQMGAAISRGIITEEQQSAVMANSRLHDHSPWDIIFNIDPQGCEDVDDVMGWRKTAKRIEFFIGIVDIAAWIPEGSPLDVEAAQAGQTLYIDGKAVEPMFPPFLSTKLASLRADTQKRPVLALVYFIEDGKLVKQHWGLLSVAISAAYTYETVLENLDIVRTLPTILGVLTNQTLPMDPHVWVEKAMVLYNTEAASILKKNKEGILRRHAGTTQQTYSTLAETTGVKELAFLGSQAGQYVSAKAEDTRHAGLALDTYCHASSPLRRYADVVNHRWLKYLLFGYQMPYIHTMSEHLNHRAAVTKQFERLIWFLQNIASDGSITTVKGIVLAYDKETQKAKVYVPAWKRIVRAGHMAMRAYEPGEEVTIRAFANLKATAITQRVVCAMN